MAGSRTGHATTLALAALVALGTLPPRRAHAETVAVIDSIIDGVPQKDRAGFQENLEESLRGSGFTVLPQATVKSLLLSSDATAGCAFGPCLRAVGKVLGVELALVVRISADGPSYSFVLTLVDTRTGAPVAQVSDTCAVCTFDEASSAATLAVVDLGMRYRDAQDARNAPPAARPAARLHRATWVMGGLTVLASGAAAYILLGRDDVDRYGWAAAGSALGLAVGTLFTF